MAKFITTKTNFSSGKLSEKLLGRPDIKEYSNGCTILTNGEVDPSGGVLKRSGIHPTESTIWRFGLPVKQEIITPFIGYTFLISINRVETIPDTQAKHVLNVFKLDDDESLTFISSEDLLLFNIALGEPDPYSGSEYHITTINNVAVLTHCSGQQIPIFIAFLSESSVAIQDLYETVTMVNQPHTTPGPIEFRYDRATQSVICDNATVAAALSNKTISVRQSEWGFPTSSEYSVCYNTVLLGTAVGNTIPIVTPPSYGFVLAGFGPTPYYMIEQARQDEVFLADWGPGNFPFTSVAHQGRLIFLGSPLSPDKVWASKTNNIGSFNYKPYYNINTPPPDILVTDHFVFTISGIKGSRLVAGATVGRGIVAATSSGSSFIFPNEATLSAFDFNVEQIDTIPVGCVEPVNGDRYAIFEAADKNGLLLAAPAESGIAEIIDLEPQIGLLDYPIFSMSFNPIKSVCTIIDDNANLYKLSLKNQTQTIAFSDVDTSITEKYGSITTSAYWKEGADLYNVGVTEDISLLFIGDKKDRLLEVAQGTPHGPLALTQELADDINLFDFTDLAQAHDTDFRATGGSDLPITFEDSEFFALAIKDDQTVFIGKVYSDGLRLDDTLPDYDVILIGLPYDMDVATMPIEAGDQWGSAQLGLKRIDRIGIWYYNSTSFKLSSDGYNVEEITLDGVETGRKEVAFSASSEYDQRVYITHDGLGPCHITSLSMRGVSNDG